MQGLPTDGPGWPLWRRCLSRSALGLQVPINAANALTFLQDAALLCGYFCVVWGLYWLLAILAFVLWSRSSSDREPWSLLIKRTNPFSEYAYNRFRPGWPSRLVLVGFALLATVPSFHSVVRTAGVVGLLCIMLAYVCSGQMVIG